MMKSKHSYIISKLQWMIWYFVLRIGYVAMGLGLDI